MRRPTAGPTRRGTAWGRWGAACLAAMIAGGAGVAEAQITIVDTGQGGVTLSSGATSAAELSGITFAGGTRYYAVGDNGAKSIWDLSIVLDSATGRITSSGVTSGISAPGMGTDAEGIAYRIATGSAFVSDEVASTINEFAVPAGTLSGGVGVPAIYAPSNVQSNMGLESLAYGPGGLWTANEEALVPDGPLSTTSAGSWVRIQRFSEQVGGGFSTAGQWGYRTDPISALSQLTTAERSGVVDVLPWSETQLLVLERELGQAVPRFRSRLYLVDTTTASDVSALATINAGGFTPLGKTLLWEDTFALSNFEGMTFGPTLDDGSRSLLLVSDNGGGLAQNLYALRAVAAVPEPATVWLAAIGLGGLGWWTCRRRTTCHPPPTG